MDYFDDLTFVNRGEVSDSATVMAPRGFDGYWGIQYNLHGRFFVQIDGGEREEHDGACAFISFPGASFAYGAAPPENSCHRFFLCFSGARVARWLQGGLLAERRRNALIPVGGAERFTAGVQEVFRLLAAPAAPEHFAQAVLITETLLLELQAQPRMERQRNDRLFGRFETLCAAITQKPEADWDFGREAARMGVSEAHFRRLFKMFFGTPPGAYLLESRLQKAAALLLHSSAQVREIAGRCGFADEYYFSRMFRRHRNMPPLSYRREFRGL